jgi:hypothetical protein
MVVSSSTIKNTLSKITLPLSRIFLVSRMELHKKYSVAGEEVRGDAHSVVYDTQRTCRVMDQKTRSSN